MKKDLYTERQIKQTYLDNLKNVTEILPTIVAAGIKVFRLSSSLFPLFDLVPKTLYRNEQIGTLLKQIGNFVKENGIRVTTHPGQFIVLSSDNPETVKKSVNELNFHGWIFDGMGLERSPYYAINIHGGKSDRADELIKAIALLDPSAKSRLTLENCEFAYGVYALQYVSDQTGVPICFDVHHHMLNRNGLGPNGALEMAIKTWPAGIRPLTHISNSKPEYLNKDVPVTKLREHSDYLHTVPEFMKIANDVDRIDIEVEAKMKNLAIFDAVKKLGLKL